MYRIGRATKHSNERRGFHAPGTTGPFGAAVAAGRLLQLDAMAMTNAIGIAGSLACGLMEFARSGTGAMVNGFIWGVRPRAACSLPAWPPMGSPARAACSKARPAS